MSDFEARFKAAAPAGPDAADAIAAAYEAGQLDGRQSLNASVWRWRAAAAVLLCGTLGVSLINQRAPTQIAEETSEREVQETLPQRTGPPRRLPPTSMLALRNAVLTDDGIDLRQLPQISSSYRQAQLYRIRSVFPRDAG